ncbi:MAG: RHS repeat-associated core domain-containing protein, partial [Paludibacteraceae bacterium]|nr:RHS repeat-associated core domain-containing protein [Paludibacteraceae bacterium]
NLPPGPATNKGIYEKLLLEGKLDAVENPNYVAPEETTYDIPRGWPKYPVFPDSGDVPGPPIQFKELVPDSVKAGYTFTDPNMIGEVDEYFYHGDHISSVILVTDKKAKVVQQFAYMPFGELLVDNSTVDLDYRFSAKETDRESGLGYFGARYYDNTSAMWLGVDPLWEKYAGMNPYNYCAGNPVMLVDPDGRDAIFITFPDYKADGYPLTGHAGVLLIDNKTGLTKYYEYGRYDCGIQRGIVRNYKVSNVNIKDGMPTAKSLNKTLSKISEYSGKNQRLEGAYVKSDNFKAMNDYAQKRLSENNKKNRTPYSIYTNNCGTFADEVIKQDKKVDSPTLVDPRPVSMIDEYQDVFPEIHYSKEGTKIELPNKTVSYSPENDEKIEQSFWQKFIYGDESK